MYIHIYIYRERERDRHVFIIMGLRLPGRGGRREGRPRRPPRDATNTKVIVLCLRKTRKLNNKHE